MAGLHSSRFLKLVLPVTPLLSFYSSSSSDLVMPCSCPAAVPGVVSHSAFRFFVPSTPPPAGPCPWALSLLPHRAFWALRVVSCVPVTLWGLFGWRCVSVARPTVFALLWPSWLGRCRVSCVSRLGWLPRLFVGVSPHPPRGRCHRVRAAALLPRAASPCGVAVHLVWPCPCAVSPLWASLVPTRW